ncbi:MAG: hypothetical protein PUC06_05180 [Oscillospiraceae bacterium]|nr:hypothetical protein [Oscillospiraceae bacterium]
MTLKEIDEEIRRLKRLRDAEHGKQITELKKAAKKNVGRCFNNNGVYIKVVGIPQDDYTLTGNHFNQYQYPALYLEYDDIKELPNSMPFYFDTLDSGAWGEGYNPVIDQKYLEVTPEEFNEEFEKRIQEFRKRVTSI